MMGEFIVARVVIACDAVGENRSGIEMAARLAAWWNTELHGIFVQDESLLRISALPFARHIGPSGEVSRDFDEASLIHQFEAHAARARGALEAAAQEHAVGWTFDVVRGQPTLTTLSLGDQDLLVIEASSRPFAGEFRLDSRWLAQAYDAQRPILLVRNSGQKRDGVVALVQEPQQSAERTIAAATRLADASDRRLTLLLVGTTRTEAEALDCVRRVSEKVAARCRIEPLSTSASLERAAGDGSVLVVDADPAVNDTAALKELAAHSRADVLFLR